MHALHIATCIVRYRNHDQVCASIQQQTSKLGLNRMHLTLKEELDF